MAGSVLSVGIDNLFYFLKMRHFQRELCLAHLILTSIKTFEPERTNSKHAARLGHLKCGSRFSMSFKIL